MRTVTIEVTDENIAKGEPMTEETCPVALALERTFPGSRPEVDGAKIFLSVDEKRLCFDQPDEVNDFIEHFDCGDPVSPFTFTLDLDDAD